MCFSRLGLAVTNHCDHSRAGLKAFDRRCLKLGHP
jgi:hypothetical protein